MVAISWTSTIYWRTIAIVVAWTHCWTIVTWLWTWTIEIVVVVALALKLVSTRVAVVLWRLWLVVMTAAAVCWRWREHEANIHLSWAASCVSY